MIPKFRAWINTEKRMIKTCDLLDIDYENEVVTTQRVYFYFDNGLPDGRDLDNFVFEEIELMQSTGLKDKNGKEIFEGDVVRQVRTQPTTENEIIIGVVTMIEGAWLIMNDCEQLASKLWSETDENEIIGNVWEDGDLIDGKKTSEN
jgi:uncharacterized phage protein (TIGR01671 family)